jgi:hypothetical protein
MRLLTGSRRRAHVEQAQTRFVATGRASRPRGDRAVRVARNQRAEKAMTRPTVGRAHDIGDSPSIERADTCQRRSGSADSVHSQDLPARISSQMTRHHATRVSSSDAALLGLRRSAGEIIFGVPRAEAGVIGSSDGEFRQWLAAQLSPVRGLRRLSDVEALDPYLAHLSSWPTGTQQRLPPAMLETPSLVLANRPWYLLQGRKLRAALGRQSVPSPMAHAPQPR